MKLLDYYTADEYAQFSLGRDNTEIYDQFARSDYQGLFVGRTDLNMEKGLLLLWNPAQRRGRMYQDLER